MSQSKPQDGTEMVWLSTKHRAEKNYHAREDCRNFPTYARKIALSKIDGHFDPCSDCVEGADTNKWDNNQNQYECAVCGNERRIASRGVRTIGPCHDCGEMQTFERLEP